MVAVGTAEGLVSTIAPLEDEGTGEAVEATCFGGDVVAAGSDVLAGAGAPVQDAARVMVPRKTAVNLDENIHFGSYHGMRRRGDGMQFRRRRGFEGLTLWPWSATTEVKFRRNLQQKCGIRRNHGFGDWRGYAGRSHRT